MIIGQCRKRAHLYPYLCGPCVRGNYVLHNSLFYIKHDYQEFKHWRIPLGALRCSADAPVGNLCCRFQQAVAPALCPSLRLSRLKIPTSFRRCQLYCRCRTTPFQCHSERLTVALCTKTTYKLTNPHTRQLDNTRADKLKKSQTHTPVNALTHQLTNSLAPKLTYHQLTNSPTYQPINS